MESYRGEPLQRRLSACLRTLHADTEESARLMIERRPDLLQVAVSALLIGVTDFFRDASVFRTLQTEVLPKLPRRRPLRIWSAGCANGAELYSLAILLSQTGLLEGSYLLGSDCRHDAIEKAKASLYSSDELRLVEPLDRQRSFDHVGNLWRPKALLRRHVHWAVADFGRRIEAGPWDMILWRNVAIYLEAAAAASLWRGLVSVLAPEGVIVVGKAERPPVELRLICVKRCIYRACGHNRQAVSSHESL